MLTIKEKIKNAEIIDYYIKQANLIGADSIEMECFNKEEANWCEKYIQDKYPEMPYRIIWLDFEMPER